MSPCESSCASSFHRLQQVLFSSTSSSLQEPSRQRAVSRRQTSQGLCRQWMRVWEPLDVSDEKVKVVAGGED